MWLLAIVGGSAWKMEARLGRFCREHLSGVLDPVGGVQVAHPELGVAGPALRRPTQEPLGAAAHEEEAERRRVGLPDDGPGALHQRARVLAVAAQRLVPRLTLQAAPQVPGGNQTACAGRMSRRRKPNGERSRSRSSPNFGCSGNAG